MRIVTIDGPAGGGKSTVAQRLAGDLGWLAFGSGAVYRAVTLLGLGCQVALDDPEQIIDLLQRHRLEIREQDGKLVVIIDGQEPPDKQPVLGLFVWGYLYVFFGSRRALLG